MDYSVNINVFQGPFELLFYLIESKEIDIYDIPIAEITDQYLDHLEQMLQFNMNVASEFIVMAATLIEIKSQMLLPQKEKDEDPREDLVSRLLEYKAFKEVAEELKKFEEESSYYFSKPKEELALTTDVKREQLSLNEIDVYELCNVYLSLVKRQSFKIDKEERIDIYRENYRVSDCMEDLVDEVDKFGKVSLFNTFEKKKSISKEYIITLFLAILELSNKQSMKLCQDDIYGDIIIVGL